ncbi:hypothetical protein [Alkalihalobacterium chitinilyticum]|uniref:DUF3139 domain-containing protein n=1 Tax=Alkalihalobacterium chitinilyticum TaxID=2980103 RepID=A0ABT5VIH0_9BACI|nr:hypothetical protein [Alkalihalobacterium chitinilyticum]MDE5415255.1 hypothetical protein [Alkalihalobacterium chitinilyticum]
MANFKKVPLKERVISGAVVFVIFISFSYYTQLFKPVNSLDLYQLLSFAKSFEKAQSLMLDGYEANFKEEDYEFITSIDNQANSINQFTLFEYEEKTYLIKTSPGTRGFQKLKVHAIEEVPPEVRNYFLELAP